MDSTRFFTFLQSQNDLELHIVDTFYIFFPSISKLVLDKFFQWRPIVLPDNYIEHASPTKQLALAGLTGHHIAATALSLLGRTREALLLMC